ncbi:hypothetical protein [Halobacterium zhouii]|uniref:hypothetical protein n=1 Tax=Halobacterium zhouii TaxID=2902624 RepID=UPI001E465285|nr:hypothetical protein [Halobacterium zhouii]
MTDPPSTRARLAERPDWWKPIAGIVASLVVTAVLGAVLPPDAYVSLLLVPFVLVGFGLAVLSPVFVYFDRRYLADADGWTPSEWYYLMWFPPLALVLPALYLYRRHRRVGVPRNPLA